jgi:hypothetical protein
VLRPGLAQEYTICLAGDVPVLPYDIKELFDHWGLLAALDLCCGEEEAQGAGDHEHDVHEVLSHQRLLSWPF